MVVRDGRQDRSRSRVQHQISIDESIDLGEVARGQSVRGVLAVRNDSPVRIESVEVKTSCGCTSLGDIASTIEPGEVVQIPFAIEASQWHVGVKTAKIWILSGEQRIAESRLIHRVAEPFTMDAIVDADGVCQLELEPSYADEFELLGVFDRSGGGVITSRMESLRLILLNQELSGKEIEIIYRMARFGHVRFSQIVRIPLNSRDRRNDYV